MSTLINFAARAALVAKYGIPVIPINPREKKATLEKWPTLATTDPAQIAKWNKENPDFNCGAVGRKGEFWILDADRFVGLSEQIERETGHQLDSSDTLMVKSSEGKLHIYFKHDARSEALGNFSVDDKDGEVFSVRAHNSYVVGPGSIHPKTGLAYEILSGPTFGDIPIAPEWLMDWLEKSKPSTSVKTSEIPETIPEHSRNKVLTSLAGTMRRRGATKSVILAALRETNKTQCAPPLPDAEVSIIAGSIAKCKPAVDVQTFYVESSPAGPAVAESTKPSIARPVLSETAFHGLAGKIIKKLEPRTEAHPAGLLVELLISLGSVMGGSAYFQVDDTRHYTNEFMVKVGESSRARKGTGKDRIRAILNLVDLEWVMKRNKSGIGSGEIIIHLVRDAQEVWFFDKKKGEGKFLPTDAGVDDKRLCVSMGEFQGILAACGRADSQMSVVMRDGWDHRPLHNLVKTSPASSENAHLSLMADTTRADLGVSLSQADKNNGFANRFLWVYVWRSHELPEGGGDIDWTEEAAQLREAVNFGKQTGRVFMDETARKMWCRTLYSKLEREIPGIVGAITGRASAHTIRLAMLYALLDKSDHIRTEHLEAAAALWQYCEDSVQAIFGDLLSPEQTKIIEFLTAHGPSIKRRLIHECFQRHRPADLIQADLDVLRSRDKVTVKDTNYVPLYTAK